MKKFWKRLGLRLDAVWSVLTTDYILISHIKRNTTVSLTAHTQWQVQYRTFNPDEHDFLVVKGEALRKYDKLPDSVKADNHV